MVVLGTSSPLLCDTVYLLTTVVLDSGWTILLRESTMSTLGSFLFGLTNPVKSKVLNYGALTSRTSKKSVKLFKFKSSLLKSILLGLLLKFLVVVVVTLVYDVLVFYEVLFWFGTGVVVFEITITGST